MNTDHVGCYRWQPFVGWGRHQFRIGIRRNRRDRVSPEYRFIALEWQL
jgi:hypothetical protein